MFSSFFFTIITLTVHQALDHIVSKTSKMNDTFSIWIKYLALRCGDIMVISSHTTHQIISDNKYDVWL